MVNNDFQLLIDELDDLVEKISTCNGPEGVKALATKLNELNNKYNKNTFINENNKEICKDFCSCRYTVNKKTTLLQQWYKL